MIEAPSSLQEPIPPSALQELIEGVHYRLLLYLDEAALCSVGQCCAFFGEVVGEQALWQRLAVCRDRLVVSRFLGARSCYASDVLTAEDPRPAALPGRALGPFKVGAGGASDRAVIDWRNLCRQLNTRMAERPWGAEDSADPSLSAAVWSELTDGWRTGIEEEHMDDSYEAALPPGGIYGSQAPRLFWLGGNRLLAFSGGYSPEMLGGAQHNPLGEVYLIDLLCAASQDMDAEPNIRVTRLDCGTANGRLPHGGVMNGTACDFDPVRRAVYFFGGGSPHRDVCNVTSMLRLQGDGDFHLEDVTSFARWEVVETLGTPEAGQVPSGRQGLQGTIFCNEFIIFGGRSLGGNCHNDVWSLDLTELDANRFSQRDEVAFMGGAPLPARGSSHFPWRQLMCEGSGPSPRVWYGACHAVHGRWFIYGGSTWQFAEPEEPHDYRVLYVLDLAARQWSSFDPSPGPGHPPWVVAPTLLALGSCQLLLLGGVFPQKVGSQGLNAESLHHWRSWYSRIDAPHIFDLGTGTWTARHAAVSRVAGNPIARHLAASRVANPFAEEHITEVYLRSHLAAAFVPTRRSVLVFGGSRYFTGEYFNDILELQLPGCDRGNRTMGSGTAVLGEGRDIEAKDQICGDLEAANDLPRHLRRSSRHGEILLTRGLIGRLRAMTRDGLITPEEFAQFVQEFAHHR